MKRKDDAIASLQLQLEEEKKRADIEHLMNSSGRNSSGLRDRDNWEDSGAADEVNRRLKLDLEEALTRLQKEQLAHSQTRDELNQMKMDAIDMESRMASLGTARERSTNNTFTDRSGFDPQQMKELRGLREKTIDQAEQIEVTCKTNDCINS